MHIYLNYSNSCVVLLVVSVEQEKLTKYSRKFFKHINSKVVKEILNLFNSRNFQAANYLDRNI